MDFHSTAQSACVHIEIMEVLRLLAERMSTAAVLQGVPQHFLLHSENRGRQTLTQAFKPNEVDRNKQYMHSSTIK